MKRSKLEIMKTQTKNTMLLWKYSNNVVSKEVKNKMDMAMLEWMIELTNCLETWLNKGETMTIGELILARVNMGALVESWLKFFYCVYYIDYMRAPLYGKNNTPKEPEDIKFEYLKQFGVGKLWTDVNVDEYKWVDKIQHMRNAIHAFNYTDIGTAKDFIEDMEKYCAFVNNIYVSLPPLEDWVETLPEGYVINVNFE